MEPKNLTDRDLDPGWDQKYDGFWDCNQGLGPGVVRDRDWDLDRDQDQVRDRDWDRDLDRVRDQKHDQERDRDLS